MRCLVTGGGGFLGAKICEKLAARGDEVISFSRKYHKILEQWGVEQVLGTLTSLEQVKNACQKADVIFHCAAKVGHWGNYQEYYQVNVKGTKNLITACEKKEKTLFIHTSTPSVIMGTGDLKGVDECWPFPKKYLSYYSETKAMAELEIRKACNTNTRFQALILRPHVIWGPGDTHLIPRILDRKEKVRIIGDGQNLIDTIYIDNAADAHILAMERLSGDANYSGRCYFICQNEPLKLWDLIKTMLGWLNFSLPDKKVPFKLCYFISTILEVFYKVFKIKKEPFLTRYVTAELAKNHWFDTRAAREDLHFTPAVSVEEGLRRTKEWVQKKWSSNE